VTGRSDEPEPVLDWNLALALLETNFPLFEFGGKSMIYWARNIFRNSVTGISRKG
jgi:hypothetical protein